MSELVSHDEMSPLNASAPINIRDIAVTELVSHDEMSPLNAPALINIQSI